MSKLPSAAFRPLEGSLLTPLIYPRGAFVDASKPRAQPRPAMGHDLKTEYDA
jgi:hypothetical protein